MGFLFDMIVHPFWAACGLASTIQSDRGQEFSSRVRQTLAGRPRYSSAKSSLEYLAPAGAFDHSIEQQSEE